MKKQQRQKEKKINIRPYTRQFYRGNGWRFALAMVDTLVTTTAAMMISWLIQQIIDLPILRRWMK